MEKWSGQVAFVTGASSGIGEAIAKKLVEEGLKVVGFARRIERLEELGKKISSKKGKFYPRQGDISKEEDILKAFQWTKENVGPVSIVINNAGITGYAKISESSTQLWRDTLEVNVIGLCIATREAIKQMKENNIDGHVININSIAGHSVLKYPELNLYSPSKHAVTALTETLRFELAAADSKIRVTSISPGAVDTNIITKTLEQVPSKDLEAIKSQMKLLRTEDVADATLYVLSAPKHVNISELTIQVVGETIK